MKDKAPVVAIVGAGEMGSAVGRRLHLSGARVVTETRGRSADSRRRVESAGLEVIDDDDAFVKDADFLLSIVPPGVAIEVARRFVDPIRRATNKAAFVECNAIAPATTIKIAEILAPAGCKFIDAGVIGGPPGADPGSYTPRIYASGEHAHLLAALNSYGLDIAVLDGEIGAASGLKMSYAGITKGMTAIASVMVAGAARAGLADALYAELARSQPDQLRRMKRGIPGMLPKAYRWVAEMEQIAEFLKDDAGSARIYEGAAKWYAAVSGELDGKVAAESLPALKAFAERKD
jgi:3-hydroxyisobutyrate dehydrogenase-like beta-hydroxyacid dehydrogenase